MVQIVAAHGSAFGQGTFHIRPFVSAAQVYESNLFSTSSDRQEDFITRVTPGIESDYRSHVWTLSGRYALDAERFADHADLTAMDARQQTVLSFGYRPTPRVTVAGGAEYLATRTPAELNVATGLSFTRARASRFSTHSSMIRQLTPVAAGTIEYTFTSDRLGPGFEAYTHASAVGVDRRLSSRTTVTGRYRAQGFTFTSSAHPRSVVVSHALGVGVTRAMTRNLGVSIDAGPRLTGDVVRPELAASVTWNESPVNLSFGYGRTQSTAMGLVGTVDTQRLQATLGRTFGRSIEVRVMPAVFRSALAGMHADVYVLAVGMTHQLANGLAFDLSFDGAQQHGTLVAALAGETIPRHSVVIRLVAGPPRREPRREH